MQIRKNKKAVAASAHAARQTAEESLAWAAGTEQFSRRDPLYHVTENFQQTFDRIGRSHARALVGGFTPEEPEEKTGRETGEKQREKTGAEAGGNAGGREKEQHLRTGNTATALTRFSDIAFQRGTMSASVLNGTGKMMLVSCLKRTVGESGPKRIQEQGLLDTGSQLRNIPDRKSVV